MDPELRVVEAEATGLCLAARNLFFDGVHKVRLGSGQEAINVLGNALAAAKHEALRA